MEISLKAAPIRCIEVEDMPFLSSFLYMLQVGVHGSQGGPSILGWVDPLGVRICGLGSVSPSTGGLRGPSLEDPPILQPVHVVEGALSRHLCQMSHDCGR